MVANPKKHIFVEDIIYAYRQRKTSAMHTITSKKHMINMLGMANYYNERLGKYIPDSFQYQITLMRRDKAVTAVLYDAIWVPSVFPRDVLESLEQDGLYPTRFAWWTIKLSENRSFKGWIINAFEFLFPIKLYYLIVSKVLCKLRKD